MTRPRSSSIMSLRVQTTALLGDCGGSSGEGGARQRGSTNSQSNNRSGRSNRGGTLTSTSSHCRFSFFFWTRDSDLHPSLQTLAVLLFVLFLLLVLLVFVVVV